MAGPGPGGKGAIGAHIAVTVQSSRDGQDRAMGDQGQGPGGEEQCRHRT